MNIDWIFFGFWLLKIVIVLFLLIVLIFVLIISYVIIEEKLIVREEERDGISYSIPILHRKLYILAVYTECMKALYNGEPQFKDLGNHPQESKNLSQTHTQPDERHPE